MSSFITVELDTSQPIINVEANSHVFQGEILEIFVTSDEELDKWHEIYVIDSENNKHHYDFKVDGNVAYGLIKFNKYPFGNATLFLTFRDSVWNQSRQYRKDITIKNSDQLMRLEISDSSRSISEREHITNMDIGSRNRRVDVNNGRE